MQLKEALSARRSVRAFESTPLSQEQIEALLTAATWAPSPLNLQPWQFLLISQDQGKARVKEVAQEAVGRVLEAGGPGWVKKYGLDFLTQAPLLIVVLSDPNKGGLGGYFNQSQGALVGSAAAVQNLMLTAAEMGLGTLWFTFFDPQAMKAALAVPAELDIVGLIPVGVPAEEAKAPPRKPPKVHRELYGQ